MDFLKDIFKFLGARKKFWLAPVITPTAPGITATVTGGGGGVTVTVACADDNGLATEVARTVTVAGFGTAAGAV